MSTTVRNAQVRRMVPPPKLARLLATEPLLAAALAAPGSAVNLQCARTSHVGN